MTQTTQMVLLLLALLQVKHLFADFFLQTERMLSGRGDYLHLGRVQHAGLHGLLSFLCLMLVGVSLGYAAIICLVEAAVHFHIDWAKGRYSDKTDHGPADPGFWRAFGVDQFLHQVSYIAMVGIVVIAA